MQADPAIHCASLFARSACRYWPLVFANAAEALRRAPRNSGRLRRATIPAASRTDLVPGVLKLSLQDAMDRGLKQNLGLLLSGQDVRTARGARWQELSALLPNVTTSSYVDGSKMDLAEFGFSFKFPRPGISIPAVVGPFAYFDSRAYVTQSVSRSESAQQHALRVPKSENPRNTVSRTRAISSSWLSATPTCRRSRTKPASKPPTRR